MPIEPVTLNVDEFVELMNSDEWRRDRQLVIVENEGREEWKGAVIVENSNFPITIRFTRDFTQQNFGDESLEKEPLSPRCWDIWGLSVYDHNGRKMGSGQLADMLPPVFSDAPREWESIGPDPEVVPRPYPRP